MSRAVPKPGHAAVAPALNLDGLDPRARERAGDVARRRGLTLADLLTQLIADADEEPPPAPARRSRRSAPAPAPAPVRGAKAPPRKAPGGGRDAAQMSRLTSALVEFAGRLDAVEHRSGRGEADHRGAEVLARLDGVERRVSAIAALCQDALEAMREREESFDRRLDDMRGSRVEGVAALGEAVAEVATQIGRAEARAELNALQAREGVRALRHRLDRLEARPTIAPAELAELVQRVDAMEAAPARADETALLDAAFARLLGHVEEGRRHADGSLRALEGALAGLEQWVGQMPARPAAPVLVQAAPGPDAAAPAPAAIEAAETSRAAIEAAETSRGADAVEAVVRELSGQLAATEHRSAAAIKEMGCEVIRIAQSLDGRVAEVERRSDERAAVVGGEMSRLADAVDDRLTRADDARAEALEELGGRIASVADQLADTIAASEGRNAQVVAHGLDQVGERLQRAIDKLNVHYERAAGELADQVRQGQERTVKLVADVTEQIVAAQPRPPAPAPLLRRRPPSEAAAPPDAPESPPRGDLDRARGLGAEPPVQPSPSPPVQPSPSPPPAPSPAPSPAAPPRPGSHRDMIEQARAVARTTAEASRPGWKGRPASPQADGSASSRAAPDAAEVLVLRGGLGGLLRRRGRDAG